MTMITIDCSLHAGTSCSIELPDGKAWVDVEEWYVKWDTLNVKFKGDPEYREIPLNSDSQEVVDWKRPHSVEIYSFDEESDETDYSETLAEV